MKKYALIGNPNCGKTTIFNLVTDSYAHVGNWPGVTVEKKIGVLKNASSESSIIDLPGVYSISPITIEDKITCSFLLNESFDGIIHIIDASQLDRSMQLTIQLLELGKPLLLVFNMMDINEKQGIQIDTRQLEEHWRVPILCTVARKSIGIKELREAILRISENENLTFSLDYGPHTEGIINKIVRILPNNLTLSPRWVAIQYLDQNPLIENWMMENHLHLEIESLRELYFNHLQQPLEKQSRSMFRDIRESYIQTILDQCRVLIHSNLASYSRKIDRIVTHPLLGVPLFFLLMFLVFKITFDWVGSPMSDQLGSWLDEDVSGWLTDLLTSWSTSTFLIDLVVSGLLGGVGGVLAFVPQIFLLFLLISIIEDSGYMTRITFLFDRFMQYFGLHGKTLIPMIIGFGCNVPAVMAARTIEQPQERLATILLTPLMSCSARLPVFSLLVGTFFKNHQSIIVFSLYLLGIVFGLLIAYILSRFTNPQEKNMFFVEWPSYHFPVWKTLWRSTWIKTQGFIKKAGTFIFGGTVIIWLLGYISLSGVHVPIDQSILAMMGNWIAPLFDPLGFASWQTSVALITGFLAKEVVVSTMLIVYASTDEQTLVSAIEQAFTPLQAYSFMVFVLLYVPCIATVAVIQKETGSMKWTWFSVGYSLLIGYVCALLIYQIGSRWFVT